MSAGIIKNGVGCVEVYQANLEQRLQQGKWDLVCHDEELCKEVETRLSECSPRDFCPQLGFDTLSVIETSLRASQHSLSRTRLKSLGKAFEVLELAALNLHLCPWRKEYKVVKMFSGMFTHCIKPALTAQQAKELFALLGYQPGSSSEEELRLAAKPVHSLALLQLACAFFTARIECQLLLSAGDSKERVLQLIHEIKRGCTFQTALDRAAVKPEPDPRDTPLALDGTVDLYTDETLAEHGHMASPPSLPYIPPSDDSARYGACRGSASQSNYTAPVVSVSSLTYQITSTPQKPECDNERRFTATDNAALSASKEQQPVCTCLKSHDRHRNRCLQCRQDHSLDCARFGSCIEKGHQVIFAGQQRTMSGPEKTQRWAPKDDLKPHSCINKTSNDFFFICHNCQYIHDLGCVELQQCYKINHNVQNTGRLQPAQPEEQATPHECMKVETADRVVCRTCNKSHDYLCNEVHSCQLAGHNVRYDETAAQAKPMPLHHCCTFTRPAFACLTCRAFHGDSCDGNQCQRQHEVQRLGHACCTCADAELHVLCRYCCAQHCKNCWFKTPLACKCGMPFDLSAV